MALPRDIDPRLKKYSNITLLHIDDFGVKAECDKEDLKIAKEILSEYKQDFIGWYHMREWAPRVNEISELVGALVDSKLTKVYKGIKISEQEKEVLQESIQVAVKKAVSKVIFDLREHMEREQYDQVLQALEQTTPNNR